jgi:hypothetical protein
MPESPHERSDNNDNRSDDSESFIGKTLDIFLFKPLLSVLPQKYITQQFISGFLLSVFLIFLYSTNGLLKLDWSIHMLILYVTIVLTAAEIVRRNFPILNNWFSNDQKSLYFFENLNSMTDEQMTYFVKFHIFSSKCINKMLKIVRDDVNKIPPDIVEYALTTQDLTKENLDLLFSKDIELNEYIVKFTLIQKKNQLTDQNLFNILDKYKENPSIIKVLFATQNNTKKFIENNKNIEFMPYWEKYQIEKKHLDIWLKIIPISWVYIYNRKKFSLFYAAIVSSILSTILAFIVASSPFPIGTSSAIVGQLVITAFISSWFISFVCLTVLFKIFIDWVSKRYISHFFSNVESVQY